MMRVSAMFAIIIAMAAVAPAQVRPPGEETLSPDLDPAIARALSYLARQQQPDGSFRNREKDEDKRPPRFSGPRVALTGLSLMAYLSSGRMPDVGKHGMVVRNGIDYLIKSCPDDGYYGKVDSSQLYGHAIATLALAEVYGMETDATQRVKARQALERSVKVLLAAQNVKKDDLNRGGWRYEVGSGDSDLSVTSWCILALRAANSAGISVPRESADRAAEFVLNCWRPDQKGFAYQPRGEVSLSMTSAGLLDLHLLGRGSRLEVAAAARYLREHPLDDKPEYPYYARYQVTHAAFHAGGDTWRTTWERAQSKVLQSQQKDGSWPQSRNSKEPGSTYATAISVMTLSIPLRLLPTHQR